MKPPYPANSLADPLWLLPRRGSGAGHQNPLRVLKHAHHKLTSCCLPYNVIDLNAVPAIKRVCADSKPFNAFMSAQQSLLHRLADSLQLEAAYTTVSQDGISMYNSPDSSVAALIQVAKGRQVSWAVASAYALAAIGGGSVRINVFPDQSVALPKLDLELFTYFDKIHMYLNLAARANLLLDEGYSERYYRRSVGEPALSWHTLYLACRANPALTPFQSEAHDIRVLAGQTALFYSAEASAENIGLFVQAAQDALTVWLSLLACEASFLPPTAAQDLMRYDSMYLKYCYKDPDNQRVSKVFGDATLQEMLRLSSKHPDILI